MKYLTILIAIALVGLAGCSKADEPAEMMNLYTGTVKDAEVLRCQANLKQLTTSAMVIISQNPDLKELNTLTGPALFEGLSNLAPHTPINARLLSCPGTGAKYRGPVDFNTFMKITGGGTEHIAMCSGCGNILQGGGAVIRSQKGTPQYQESLDSTVE